MIDDAVVDEIINTLLEQGELTKVQVRETWDIAKEDYPDLHKRVLKKKSFAYSATAKC